MSNIIKDTNKEEGAASNPSLNKNAVTDMTEDMHGSIINIAQRAFHVPVNGGSKVYQTIADLIRVDPTRSMRMGGEEMNTSAEGLRWVVGRDIPQMGGVEMNHPAEQQGTLRDASKLVLEGGTAWSETLWLERHAPNENLHSFFHCTLSQHTSMAVIADSIFACVVLLSFGEVRKSESALPSHCGETTLGDISQLDG